MRIYFKPLVLIGCLFMTLNIKAQIEDTFGKGINAVAKDSSFSIKFSTRFQTLYQGNYNIDITTLNGQLIYSKELQGTENQLNLSSYAGGVYFITVRSKDFVTTRKIIKL